MSTFKIYTKTGDAGTTSLYTGDRISKDHAIFQSLGSLDELNAHLGLARHYYTQMVADKPVLPIEAHEEQLREIQARLIDVGSHVATPRDSNAEENEKKLAHTTFEQANTDALEAWIDQIDA